MMVDIHSIVTATGAGLARGRLLASFSFREQEQVA